MEKQKRKVAIIGAGVSGMTAAVELVDRCDVHLYEVTNRVGGRATTIQDNKTQEIIDNGQHICIGAYNFFFDFLKSIGGMDHFQILEKYDIPYFYNGRFGALTSKIFTGKFGLLEAILRDSNFSFKEKWNTIVFALKVQMDSISFQNYSDCYDLLYRNNQSENVIRVLWEPLIVSTMNTPIKKASPLIFENIMLDGFLGKSQNAAFYLPKSDFGKLFEGFESFFSKNNNKLYYNTPIKTVNQTKGKYLVNNEYYDYVIITTPSFISKRILSELPLEVEVPDYSPIISVYFWTDSKLFDSFMISSVDSCFDWIFNRDKLLDRREDTYSYQITTSDAVRFAKLKDEDIMTMMESDLRRMFGEEFKISHFKIVRELMATFLADKKNNQKRPKVKTSLQGLYLAGDYSDNGYPSTLEGAAKNGFRASHYILKHIQE